MPSLNAHKIALIFGVFSALMHALWALLVAGGLAKPLIDLLSRLHFMKTSYTLLPFSAANALGLVLVAFVIAYGAGFVFAMVWNRFHR